MNLELIRYKNYVWKNNPRQIKIIHNRNVQEVSVPYSHGVVRDYGERARVIRGVGEFFGEKCIDEFEKLRAIQQEGGKGYLTLPMVKPFLAIFRLLELEENPTPKLLKYSFEFVEYISSHKSDSCYVKRYHVVQKGENLWDVSNKYNVSVENLLDLNLHIKRPDNLILGEKVKIV